VPAGFNFTGTINDALFGSPEKRAKKKHMKALEEAKLERGGKRMQAHRHAKIGAHSISASIKKGKKGSLREKLGKLSKGMLSREQGEGLVVVENQ